MKLGTRLGAGLVGQVYDDPTNPNRIIKVIDPCHGKEAKINKAMCEANPKIEKIPRGNCKSTVYRPNEVNEFNVGIDLARYQVIVKTFAHEVGPNHKVIFEEEKCQTDLISMLNTVDDYNYFLFYTAFYLMKLQQDHRFVHYDLHYANVLYLEEAPKLHKNIDSLFSGITWHPKIGDFGFARYEVGKKVYLPKVNDIPDRSYGKYNPYYDFLSLLFSLRVVDFNLADQYKTQNPFKLKILENPGVKRFFDELFDFIFGSHDLTIYVPGIVVGSPIRAWRCTNNIGLLLRIRSLPEITEYLFRKYLELNRLNPNNVAILKNRCNLDFRTRLTDVIVPKFQTKYQLYFGGNMAYEYHVLSRSRFSDSLLDQYELERLDDQQTIHIHIMRMHKNTFKSIKYVCCDQDYYEFLDSNKPGIIVSGNYFRYKTGEARIPIGKYRDASLKSDIPLPMDYADDFEYVSFDDNYNLVVSRDMGDSDYILSTSPVLVKNGVSVFNEDKLEQKNSDGIYKYLCSNTPQENVVSCREMQPGNLYHAANPNPRTCIGQKGDDIYLIGVEGRADSGYGISLFKLAKLCANVLNLDICVNLDGGTTSMLAWKENWDTIYAINRTKEYQMGNLIYFTLI